MSIGIFFGSTGGNTRDVAETIAKQLGCPDDSHDVAAATAADMNAYDLLILATSTWGMGDIQDDWESFLPQLADVDLAGKRVGLVGLGDACGYPDTFVDGMADIAEVVTTAGAELVGAWPTDGYDFDESRAVEGDQFIGLVIDEDNESELTSDRITAWLASIAAVAS